MNVQTIHSPGQDSTPSPEVSPVLETCSTRPVSTHWIPLHELIAHWTDVDPLLAPRPWHPC